MCGEGWMAYSHCEICDEPAVSLQTTLTRRNTSSPVCLAPRCMLPAAQSALHPTACYGATFQPISIHASLSAAHSCIIIMFCIA